MKEKFKYLFYLFLPIILGGITGFIIKDSIDYTSLVHPPLAPPKLAFPIAWSIIYILMGLSYFIYKRDYKEFDKTDRIYYWQLLVNVFWSIIFFLLKWRFVSILWIVLLDVLVIITISLFKDRKKVSAYLNVPYLLWILFATYLTIGIYILN